MIHLHLLNVSFRFQCLTYCYTKAYEQTIYYTGCFCKLPYNQDNFLFLDFAIFCSDIDISILFYEKNETCFYKVDWLFKLKRLPCFQ
jgi:hypothetical protein